MAIPRVKICGITRVEDALAAARLGADAIGLVFYAPSPRAVSVQQAARIVRALPPFVTTVGLFVNATGKHVTETLENVPLDLLQFHGDETPEYCQAFQRPWIKAVRMKEQVDLHQQAARYALASALLVDSYVPGVPGGTGATFNWQRLPQTLSRPLILAGGLAPANVAEAVCQVQPWAVDVSGGVEQQSVQGRRAGIKDASAMRAFINAVK